MFIGRDKELVEMNRLYKEDKFQMFVIYGRRRVGKTTLIKEFCQDKPNIFYSAEQSNNKNNLTKFSEQVFEYYGETGIEPFSSWSNAFSYIINKQNDDRLVLIIDEFPYLADSDPSLLSVMQHLIDHRLINTKLYLILCGSYMGFMEKEVLGEKSPIFGRRTGQLHLKPMNYIASSGFLEGFSLEEKALLYGVYGGTPMYLQQADSNKTIKQNIIDSILKPTSYLYEEPLLLLRQEVTQPGIYSALIEAIASGATKANDISTKTGEETAKCLKYIGMLRELGIVHKELPFGEKDSSRKAIYQLSDLMFRFWYRYVFRNKTLLENDGQEAVWKRKIEPDLNNYMGHVFEVMCMDFMLARNSAGELPILFTEIGRWWGADKRTQSQAEIDLVAQDGDSIILGECKWRNELLDLSVLEKLKSRTSLFNCDPNNAYFALFSKSGFTDSVRNEAVKDSHIMLYSLSDMF